MIASRNSTLMGILSQSGGAMAVVMGSLVGPQVGIAVDSSGNVYVADYSIGFTDNDRIQKFDSDGNFITKWGSWRQW